MVKSMNKHIKFIKENDIGRYLEKQSLSEYTTYKVGGEARLIVYPKDETKLIELLKYIKNNDINYKILGNGSNTIFSSKTFDGIIIKLDEFNKVEVIGNKIIVGAGYNLMKLSALATRKSLSGLEFASGIPGTVGGAIYMNAGAYKSDMGFIVQNVKVITPELKIITMANKEMKFHYRDSFLQHHKGYICLEAVLKLKPGKRNEISEINNERKKRRLESQPLEYPSAGSVFRNPDGMFAGKMIEDIGLKGLTKGGAQISNKHANFIINIGGATAEDIKDLIEFVQTAVYDNYGVKLKVEQEFVNWE